MLLVIEQLLDATTVADWRQRLQCAHWCDGRATAGGAARSVKANQQLDDRDPLALELGQQLLGLLGRHPQFLSAALPERIHPPRFNRYADGGHYGTHVDAAIMHVAAQGRSLRSDLSATLFLCEPEDYDGGELQVETPFGLQSVKLAAGDLVLYPSSSLHRVTPVSRGARIAAFLWLQSLVREDAARGLLYELDQRIQSLATRAAADDADVAGLTSVYHNLLRRWAQP